MSKILKNHLTPPGEYVYGYANLKWILQKKLSSFRKSTRMTTSAEIKSIVMGFGAGTCGIAWGWDIYTCNTIRKVCPWRNAN